MLYRVPFGDGELSFELKWSRVDVATHKQQPPALDPVTIHTRLMAFAETLPLERPIMAVFTDATRASPDQMLLEPIVEVVQRRGGEVRFLCAIGMHRPSTAAEKLAKLGPYLAKHYEILDHDPNQVVQVGEVDEVPIEINPLLLNTTILTVGVVEPHQYAGYSGGSKTAVIGCGGPTTIARTHGPEYLNKAGTRLGNIHGNPFQELVRQAGRLIGHQYAVNVVMGTEGEIVYLEMGAPDVVHDKLVEQARRLYECPVPHAPYDVVIAGGGAPKDANFYQTSRAATYIGLTTQPVLRDGGVILLPAPLPEQGGQGAGEANTLDALQRFGPSRALIDHLLQVGCRPGEQRAFMIAQLLQRFRLIVVEADEPDFLSDIGIESAPDMATAQAMVELDDPRVLIVPHALKTMPIA
ncbi:MAG: DUF2088 domain-containing protein [Anaerolineales bacterium]|nr:DUF2088 domain-containing protein [Anaerolineales bacterium]